MLQQTVTVQIPCEHINSTIPKFIQKANSFSSRITVSAGENSVNAKSLLGLLSLDLQQGTAVTMCADGADAEEALTALLSILEQTV